MKQLLQNMKDGKAIIEEVPIPTPKEKTARIRTGASLVSAGTERMVVSFAEKNLVGKAASRPDLVKQVVDKARREGVLSTLEAAFNKLEEPMALGYSSAGVIDALGPGLEGFKIGDRVACAGSGYAVHAEYAVIPQNLMVKIPDHLSFENAAFATIGAIALQGFRLAAPQIGESVAIIGSGLLGMLSAEISRAAGCKVLCIDLDPERVRFAAEMNYHAIIRPEAESTAAAFTHGNGFDHVLICADTSSDDPVELAGNIAREKATIVAVGAVGMNIPRKTYYAKELNFIVSRSYGPGRYDPQYEEYGHDYPQSYVRWTEGRNIAAIIDLMASGKINTAPLITHRFPIEDAVDAYQLITGKTGTSFTGVVLTYPIQEAADVVQNTRPAGTIPEAQVHPKKLIAVGILGAGNYANAVFLPAIQKVGGIQKIAIASSTGLKAAHAAKKYQFGMATSNEADILQNPAIDLVAILTRHHLHAPQIMTAIKHNKHVFCEKPLALTIDELIQIAELMEKNPDLQLTVGFNRRFAPFALSLKRFFQVHDEPFAIHYRINAGALPDTHWLNDPNIGGGRIIGEGCHFIDFMTYLIGCPPSGVTASEIKGSESAAHSNVVATYTYPDGSVGTMTYLANGDKSLPKENIEVFMGGKSAILNDFRTLSLHQKGNVMKYNSYFRQDKGQKNMWKAFLETIQQKKAPIIPYQELYQDALAAFYTIQSLESGTRLEIPALKNLIANTRS